MPKTKIDTLVQDVSIYEDNAGPVPPPGQTAYIINLTLRYVGTVDPTGQIVEDEELSIEIPSHAPPPEE